ncbi:hypothetical protein AURDEDRAFT_92423 [Auricularia subglabra TFB-10046 SS5]|uniref:Succinate dehydrogenase assembly factor 4, mitochondrial n=1 Tax=Auricularia subglabra (strain TFB-10046 / SS5) TaxID=717982 RepID=J0DAH2_AURST|nr:hypothetical protein AURDEDRAFT_92423 [Auricularia subglabra TFB-10046 SS5]
MNRPGPPPLPAAEQREFEELVKAADSANAPLLHPDARPKPAPEFEGETNPRTGEIGGPKREPTTHGDWSFGGRATDF